MKVYKLIIAYDGSDYFGWQEQPEKPSIAATLNKAFAKVFKSEIKILAHHALMRGFMHWGKLHA